LDCPALTTLTLPNLEAATSTISISDTGLSVLTLPSLVSVDRSLTVTHNNTLRELNLPALTTANIDFGLSSFTSCTGA
jgi:hypothetical protein